MTARLILLAAVLPFTGLAQLELTLYNTATNTETPLNLAQPFDVGSAAACQTITPRLRIHNIGSTTIEIQTLEVTLTGSTPAGVFKTDSHVSAVDVQFTNPAGVATTTRLPVQ